MYRRLWHDCIEFRPDYVTILIGTNDVNSQKNKKLNQQYVKHQQLPQKPDIEFFRINLGKIIVKLKRKTSAKIAIYSLPVLGEDLDSDLNQLVKEYCDIIKEYSEKYDLYYLPLNELQHYFLNRILKRKPTGYMKKNIIKILSLMIRRSFDRIAKINGYFVTYDGIHANTIGARMIEELACMFINYKGDYKAFRDEINIEHIFKILINDFNHSINKSIDIRNEEPQLKI